MTTTEIDPTTDAVAASGGKRELTVPELYAIYERELEVASEKLEDAKEAATEVQSRAGIDTFASRFTATKVSLLDLRPEDLLPPETLPGSSGVILKGARHLWPMERKGGKSLATLVMSVDIALAGSRVVILDRENGHRRYGLRLKDIASARDLTPEQLDVVRGGLSYYSFPQIRRGDRDDLTAELQGAHLVVFDSSRAFLTSLGLEEDSSDQYSKFMGEVIDPLFQQGISTLILDNAGHSDKGRARGTSSKGDLNEQLFTSEKTKEFDRDNTGEVTLEVEASRDGVPGRWTMALGGNVYGSWEEATGPAVNRKGAGKGSKGSQKKEHNKKRMQELLDEEPGITDAKIAEQLGVGPKTVANYRTELTGDETRSSVARPATRCGRTAARRRRHAGRRRPRPADPVGCACSACPLGVASTGRQSSEMTVLGAKYGRSVESPFAVMWKTENRSLSVFLSSQFVSIAGASGGSRKTVENRSTGERRVERKGEYPWVSPFLHRSPLTLPYWNHSSHSAVSLACTSLASSASFSLATASSSRRFRWAAGRRELTHSHHLFIRSVLRVGIA